MPSRLDAVRTAASSPLVLAYALLGVVAALAVVAALTLLLAALCFAGSAVLLAVVEVVPPAPDHPLLAPVVVVALVAGYVGAGSLFTTTFVLVHGAAAVAWAPFKGLAAARLGRAIRGEAAGPPGSTVPSDRSRRTLARWGWMKAKSAQFPVFFLFASERVFQRRVPVATEWRDRSSWTQLRGCSDWRLLSGFLSLAIALDGHESVRDAAAVAERRFEAVPAEPPTVRTETLVLGQCAIGVVAAAVLLVGGTSAVGAFVAAIAIGPVLVLTLVFAVDLSMRTHLYVALDDLVDDGDGARDAGLGEFGRGDAGGVRGGDGTQSDDAPPATTGDRAGTRRSAPAGDSSGGTATYATRERATSATTAPRYPRTSMSGPSTNTSAR